VNPLDDQGFNCLMWAIALDPRREEPRREARRIRRRNFSPETATEKIDTASSNLAQPEEEAPSVEASPVSCDGMVSAELVRLIVEASKKRAEDHDQQSTQTATRSCTMAKFMRNLSLSEEFVAEAGFFTCRRCHSGILDSASTSMMSASSLPPVLWAVRHINHEAAAVLVEHGSTAVGLHEAVRAGSSELVRILLTGRADPTASNETGDSAMDLALEMHEDSTDIIDCLREAAGRHWQEWTQGRRREARNVPSNVQDTGNAEPFTTGILEQAAVGTNSGGFPQKWSRRRSVLAHVVPEGLEEMGRYRLVRIVGSSCASNFRNLSELCQQLHERPWFQGTMLACLIGALFIPDMWVLQDGYSDDVLDIVLFLLLAGFVIDILVQGLGLGRAYCPSFFFFMDVIGACSLLLDLSFFRGGSGGRDDNAGDNAVIMRAARAAKLGARAGRITKLMKLLRYLPGAIGKRDAQRGNVGTAKAVTGTLVTKLSTRVSCLIIVLVMVLPTFSIFTYPDQDGSMRMWVEQLAIAIEEDRPAAEVHELVTDFRASFADRNYRPHALRVTGDPSMVMWQSHGTLSPEDELTFTVGPVVATFDFRSVNDVEAGLNLAVIVLTIMTMLLLSLLISHSVSRIALVPLELLLSQVRGIAATIYRQTDNMQQHLAMHSPQGRDEADRFEGDLAGETALLECVVKKLAALSEITIGKCRLKDEQTLQYLGQRKSGEVVLSVEEEAELNSRRISLNSEGILQALKTRCTIKFCMWDFDPHTLDAAESSAVCAEMLSFVVGKLAGCDEERLATFVSMAASGYLKTPQYHNWAHAVDVTHMLFVVLHSCNKSSLLMPWLEEAALMVSAVCHDIGHPGLTNDFLVQTSSEVAICYNDTSPLENMHCARLFEILTHPSASIFSVLGSAQYKEVRNVCIQAILLTDNAHHMELVKKLQMFGEVNSEMLVRAHEFYAQAVGTEGEEDPPARDGWPSRDLVEAVAEPEWRCLIRNGLLHFADISNPTRPFEVARGWATRVMEELFVQGDLSRQLGLPVLPLNDRKKTNLAFSQVSFIDFFVAPLVFAAARLLAPLSELAEQLVHNAGRWAEQWEQELGPPDDQLQGVSLRLRRLEDRADALLGCRPGTRATQFTTPGGRSFRRTPWHS